MSFVADQQVSIPGSVFTVNLFSVLAYAIYLHTLLSKSVS